MDKIKWNDRFNIGVESIDKAHQRLFSIVHKMLDLNDDEKDRQWICEEGIKYFKSYTLKHFADEEAYMQSIRYEGYEAHKRIHDDMRDRTLPVLERDMVESEYSVESVQHFLGICIGWLTGHIMLEDHAITGKISYKWKYEPTEETAVLEEVTGKVFKELFGLDLETVSEHYAGEDFGKRVCYRLSYRDQEKKAVQVFFILEERLVLRMISQLAGREITKTSKVAVDAMGLIAQQFMKRIGVCFHANGLYHLEKTNLMTQEQIVQDFGHEYPRYSLLFNTGSGYFALCVKSR